MASYHGVNTISEEHVVHEQASALLRPGAVKCNEVSRYLMDGEVDDKHLEVFDVLEADCW